MSEIRVNAVKNTSGVERYLAQAWVNFSGTGTVGINGSGNVSSITDNGVGDYTVNFTTAMPDVNYSYLLSTRRDATLGMILGHNSVTPTTSALRLLSYDQTTIADHDTVHVAILR